MAIRKVDNGGKGLEGTLKKFDYTIPIAREQMLTSAVTLSNVEPETSQVVWTLQESDFNAKINPTPNFVSFVPLIHVAGKGGTATAVIYYRVLLNGVSLMNGNGNCNANLNWTWNIVNIGLAGAKVGDVIEVRLWSNILDVTLDYNAIVIYPTKATFSKDGTFIKDVSYVVNGTMWHVLAKGRSPVARNNTGVGINVLGGNGNGVYSLVGSQTLPILPTAIPNGDIDTKSSHQAIYFGDSGLRTVAQIQTHATNHPWYDRNQLPVSVTLREYGG